MPNAAGKGQALHDSTEEVAKVRARNQCMKPQGTVAVELQIGGPSPYKSRNTSSQAAPLPDIIECRANHAPCPARFAERCSPGASKPPCGIAVLARVPETSKETLDTSHERGWVPTPSHLGAKRLARNQTHALMDLRHVLRFIDHFVGNVERIDMLRAVFDRPACEPAQATAKIDYPFVPNRTYHRLQCRPFRCAIVTLLLAREVETGR
ncbi:hypothetical protein PSPO01_08749 [Paraphaeosphaeria sporulosa]